jgi:aerobic-type carbon monoxide dehydrogenase small subunit (CoxS/CutS family)
VEAWPPQVFPGSTEERDALLAALRANCTCTRGKAGNGLCGAHALLLDKRAVTHLLFYRRWRAVFWPDEARSG